jgi:hypothetical protein
MSQTKRLSQLFAAESWLNNYRYLVNADFKSYDFESLREALLNYIQVNYPEDFNDFINSSEYVALVDLISYLGQNLAFRADLNLRETFLETAEVRDNILNNARQLGYKPFRNTAARGFLRIEAISTTQNLYDSKGQNLSGQTIVWSDSANPDFNEQFSLILNEVFNKNNPVGRPVSSLISNGVSRQLYEFDQPDNRTMVASFDASAKNNNTYSCEVVPMLLNTETGLIEEKSPNPYGYMTMLFNNDGTGYSNISNGWFFLFTQGIMRYVDYSLPTRIENRVIDVDAFNVNETDVWVQSIDGQGRVIKEWKQVSAIAGKNVIFNNVDKDERDIFEVVTRGNDAISIKFGDGSFGNIPTDNLRIWYRQSANANISISGIDVEGLQIPIRYIDADGFTQDVIFTLGLNQDAVGLANETITQIKNRASRTAASQDRMITASDYNTYPEGKVAGVEKIKAINRVHAGQSVFADINDPTATYRPVIVLADDAFVYSSQDIGEDTVSDDLGTLQVFKWLENALLQRSLHQFYYRNFSTIPAPNGLQWRLVDTVVGASHGFFTSDGTTPIRVGRGTTDQKLRTIRKNTLFKANDGSWHRILDIYREGFGVSRNDGTNTGVRANGEGAVFISGIQESASMVEWFPSLRTNFNPNEKQLIQQIIKDQLNFGLRYDQTTDSWKIINADDLVEEGEFANVTGRNWLIRLKHDSSNNSWIYTFRKDVVVFGSEGQLSFHNQRFGTALDQVTRRVLKDSVEILKTNVGVTDKLVFDVADYIVLDDARYDPKRVQLWLPGLSENLVPEDPGLFDKLFGNSKINLKTVEFADALGQFTVQPIADDDRITVPVKEDVTGKKLLKVQYNHVPLRDNRVNAATTNIIDMFVLTTEYNILFRNWVAGGLKGTMPLALTTFELEQLMQSIVPFKSVSDTIVFHPTKYKVIFGNGAKSKDQAIIRVTKSDGTKVSNAEIRSLVVSAINEYFSVDNWDFGESFYFTDMASWVHRRLAGVISSIVLIPKQSNSSLNHFFQIKCEEDELLISSAIVSDVEVITTQQAPLPNKI